MSVALFLSLALLSSGGGEQVATPPETPSTAYCTGARRNEVCTAQGQAALREELGVALIEDETAAGVEVYRAFYLEGGGGRPAVAFVRRPGHNPMVEVSGTGGRKMTAEVPAEVWATVREEAADADRAFVPLSQDTGGEVCLDGGAVMVEIGTPALRPRPASVRRRAVSDCAPSPTLRFTTLLANLAVARFPACLAIDPDTVSDPGVSRLSWCFRLEGDQLAAAEVRNRFRGEPGEGALPAAWRDATGLEAGTRLTWNGEVFETGAPAVLIARAAAMPGFQLGLSEIRGVSSREVRTTGHASSVTDGGSRYADFIQIWRYDENVREWRLREWTFGPFEKPPAR